MNTKKIRRFGVLAGLAGLAAVTALAFAAPAQAAGGSQPGNVSLTPSSGGPTLAPTWTTTTPCPTGNTDGADLAILADNGVDVLDVASDTVPIVNQPGGFSGVVNFTMGAHAAGLTAGHAYEWSVQCFTPTGEYIFVQSMWVTFDASGNWTSSPTPPAGATPTTTSLVANPSTASPGSPISLTGTVSPAAAAGTVEFFDGAVSLGTPVAVFGGTASQSVSTLTAGTHSITAHFAPTDPNAFAASTSSASTVTITGGNVTTPGTETIQVNIPVVEGQFVVTVDPTAVSLGTAHSIAGGLLQATGNLSAVTVDEGRTVTHPGWNISGQVSDFTFGANTIDGDSLGWTPAVTTQNTAADVVAGAAIAAGTNPGLKQGGTLAGAANAKGVGHSVLGAALDLQVPNTTTAGAYQATVTITAIDTAS